MTHPNEILDRCASFEMRGPMVSLTLVDDVNVVVLRARSDWTPVTAGKPVTDKRSDNLADLYPQARSVLKKMFENVDRATAVTTAPGPRMR